VYLHAQIVTDEESYLAAANPKTFGPGIVELTKAPELRDKLGTNCRAFVEKDEFV